MKMKLNTRSSIAEREQISNNRFKGNVDKSKQSITQINVIKLEQSLLKIINQEKSISSKQILKCLANLNYKSAEEKINALKNVKTLLEKDNNLFTSRAHLILMTKIEKIISKLNIDSPNNSETFRAMIKSSAIVIKSNTTQIMSKSFKLLFTIFKWSPKQFLKLMPNNSTVKRSFLEKLVTDPVLQSELNINSEERGIVNDALAEIYNNEKNITDETSLQIIELPKEIANLESNIQRSIAKNIDIIKLTDNEAIENATGIIASHLEDRGYKQSKDKVAVLGLILSHLMSIEYDKLHKSEKILLKAIKIQLKSYQESLEEQQLEEKKSDISTDSSIHTL